jgi:hypothetical protein
MHRRREVEVFSLSFLDCICCGFGAIILLLVLTEIGRPVVLERSRRELTGEVRRLEAQLATLRGESEQLERELQGSRETLARASARRTQLAEDLARAHGQYHDSRTDARASASIETQLAAARDELGAERDRLIRERAQHPRAAAIGGIPIDSEYVIFVIDTSSSMTSNHWDVNLAVIDELLSLYPHVQGLQVMNDQGTYMYPGTRGRWLSDSPQQRAEIRERARRWRAFSRSDPVPGMAEALRSYASAEHRVSVYVLGDEFTGDSIQAALDTLAPLNRRDAAGRVPVRIHAIGFPEGPDMSPFTNIRFSALMRLVCEQNDGTFVGMQR